MKLRKGDVVVPERGYVLACGSGIYPHAFVVSLNPFVLVSEDADMRWSKMERKAVVAVRRATPSEMTKCLTRLAE
jgi:hypothetical protein